MRVELDGIEHRIWFTYTWVHPENGTVITSQARAEFLQKLKSGGASAPLVEKRLLALRECTTCSIGRVSEEEPWVKASVYRHHDDTPNRESARKAALKRALCGVSRPTRRLFWQAYFDRKSKAVIGVAK